MRKSRPKSCVHWRPNRRPAARGCTWRSSAVWYGCWARCPEAVAQAATHLARWIRGVIGVEDRTTRPGEPGFRIGAPVFALDGRIGDLSKVVIDPHARRVTHLIIHRGLLLTEDRVVPVELVERATPEGIFLHLTSQEVARQPLYREERFVSPPPDWEPLPGYSATDILFWGSPYGGVAPPILPVVEHTVRHGIPERTIVLERSTEVRTRDDVTGEIDHLLVDPARQELTHLVVRLGKIAATAGDCAVRMG